MIKPLLPEHIDRIVELCRPFYFPVYWDDDIYARTATYPQGHFVYELDNKVVAYIYSQPYTYDKIVILSDPPCLPDNPDCYYFHDLCVDKNYQGRGIGTEIMKFILDLKIKEGWKVFSLVSVLGSFTFAERFGFKKIREIVYNGHPAFYMSLKTGL